MPPSPAPRPLSPRKLLDLLDDDELGQLWQLWHLPSDTAPERGAPCVLAAIESRARTTVVQDIVSLCAATEMLADVLGFLCRHQTSVRTTGAVLVLDGEYGVSPQQVAALAVWSDRAARRVPSVTWNALFDRWRKEVGPSFGELADNAVATHGTTWGPETDPIEAMLRTGYFGIPGEPYPPRRIPVIRWHPEAKREAGRFVRQIDALADVLQRAPVTLQSVPLRQLQDALLAMRRTLQDAADHQPGYRRGQQRIPLPGGGMSRDAIDAWNRFREDVLFLAEHVEHPGTADLLRLDLFRKRPQLYEVWCLVTLLRSLEDSGYAVTLLGAKPNDAGRCVWRLNYAKSGLPVACITDPTGRSGRASWWLFYQLFRRGKTRDEMPDLAILPSDDPDATPLWVLDPKHSPRGGYSRADYEAVARRYQKKFRPARTSIVEYYPRVELKAPVRTVLADGIEILLDVSPRGVGRARFLQTLRTLLPPTRSVLHLVDVSPSMAPELPGIARQLEGALVADGDCSESELVDQCDRVIVFATEAQLVPLADLHSDLNATCARAGTASMLTPVLRLLEELVARGPRWTTVHVHSDGQFADLSRAAAVEALARFSDVLWDGVTTPMKPLPS